MWRKMSVSLDQFHNRLESRCRVILHGESNHKKASSNINVENFTSPAHQMELLQLTDSAVYNSL
jgi:hypothetical protein